MSHESFSDITSQWKAAIEAEAKKIKSEEEKQKQLQEDTALKDAECERMRKLIEEKKQILLANQKTLATLDQNADELKNSVEVLRRQKELEELNLKMEKEQANRDIDYTKTKVDQYLAIHDKYMDFYNKDREILKYNKAKKEYEDAMQLSIQRRKELKQLQQEISQRPRDESRGMKQGAFNQLCVKLAENMVKLRKLQEQRSGQSRDANDDEYSFVGQEIDSGHNSDGMNSEAADDSGFIDDEMDFSTLAISSLLAGNDPTASSAQSKVGDGKDNEKISSVSNWGRKRVGEKAAGFTTKILPYSVVAPIQQTKTVPDDIRGSDSGGVKSPIRQTETASLWHFCGSDAGVKSGKRQMTSGYGFSSQWSFDSDECGKPMDESMDDEEQEPSAAKRRKVQFSDKSLAQDYDVQECSESVNNATPHTIMTNFSEEQRKCKRKVKTQVVQPLIHEQYENEEYGPSFDDAKPKKRELDSNNGTFEQDDKRDMVDSGEQLFDCYPEKPFKQFKADQDQPLFDFNI